MYKAENIDTDKALEAIEAFRHQKERNFDCESYGLKKYYEGLYAGLNFAESLFECANFEKKRLEVTHE